MDNAQRILVYAVISCVTGLVKSWYVAPIQAKSALDQSIDDSCKDRGAILLQHGSAQISYQGVAIDTTCSWEIPKLSKNKISIVAYKVDEAKLSKPNTGCIGKIKFPGLSYRCNMNAGDCFIYMTEQSTCNSDNVAKTIKAKLQCAEAVIRKVPEEEMSHLSFHSSQDATFTTSFQITNTYHDMKCNDTNELPTPGHLTDSVHNDTDDSPNNSTISDYVYVIGNNDNNLITSKFIGFMMLTTLPVVIAIVGVTVYLVRRNRTKPEKQTPNGASEVTQDTNLSRDCEMNEYIDTGYTIQYEMQPRNSFISFQESDNPSEVVAYTYKIETTVPENNGYLVPTTQEERYVSPPEEHEQETSIYNADPFQDDENPYEVVRDVYYRSESYSED